MDLDVVGLSLFVVLLAVVVLSILAVIQSHRRPEPDRVRRLSRTCAWGLLLVLALDLIAFVWSLLTAPPVQGDPAGRATLLAIFIAEGMNTLAFMVVSLLIPGAATIYLLVRAARLRGRGAAGPR